MKKGKFNNSNAYGVELELLRPYNVTRQDIVDKLNTAGIVARKEGYNHNTTTYWKMTTDCTVITSKYRLRGNNELVSPKLYGQDGKQQLKTVLKVLNQIGCQVNVTCGTHVHHDVTEEMLQDRKSVMNFLNNVIKLVMKYEHLLYRLISPSRLKKVGSGWWTKPARYVFGKNSTYNRNIATDYLSNQIKDNLKVDCDSKHDRHGRAVSTNNAATPRKVQNSRYCGLNLKNIWTRGSIEFRYHQGTLNFEKLWAWIVFTQAFLNAASDIERVNFGTVKRDKDGFFHMRRALGFIGNSTAAERCEDMKFSNKVMVKRFKEMSTSPMEAKRRNTKFYYTIKENLVKGA